jgi:hypothetical protein
MRLVVSRVDRRGQILALTLPVCRPDNSFGVSSYSVGPADIARWVRLALASGWMPNEPGPAFSLRLGEEHLDPTKVKPDDDNCLVVRPHSTSEPSR